MWKISSFTVGAVIVLGLMYQNYTLRNDNIALQKSLHHVQDELAKEKSAEHKLAQEVQSNQNELQRAVQLRTSDIQTLQNQLTTEQTRLAQMREQLTQIRNQNPSSDSQAVQAQISRDHDRLNALNARLKEYQVAEGDVSKQAKEVLDAQKAQTKTGQYELNQQIKTQQELIKTTDKDLQAWRKKKNDVNQLIRIDELSKQLEDQKAVLLQLQQEKADFAFSESQRSKSIQGEASQERGDLKDTQAQIKKQIQETQQDLKQLETHTGKTQAKAAAIQAQAQQAQYAYDLQQQKVTNL